MDQEIEEFLQKEFDKYKDIRKLKGLAFLHKMKLELSLRDPKNQKTIEHLIALYNRKKEENELGLKETFDELLKEANKITFFSIDIQDEKYYRHELIPNELIEVFMYLKDKGAKYSKNTTNYSIMDTYQNLYIQTFNSYEHYYYKYEYIDEFKITTKYYYNSLYDYEENGLIDLKSKIKENYNDHYYGTDIEINHHNIFSSNNNINLAINLALPLNDLIDIIMNLSKTYKKGKITKNIPKEPETPKTDEPNVSNKPSNINESNFIFNKIEKTYITNPTNFSSILFFYDTYYSNKVRTKFNDLDLLKEAIMKTINLKLDEESEAMENLYSNLKELYLSKNTIDNIINIVKNENNSKNKDRTSKNMENLSAKLKKIIENQLYNQL